MANIQRNKNLASNNRWRARVFGSGGEFTADEWQSLCDSYDNVCLCCHEPKELTIDHVIPIAYGGSNNIDNIQPLCLDCNLAKGTKGIDYRSGQAIEVVLGNTAVTGGLLPLRLDVTEDERDHIRKSAALAGYRSMAEFCRSAVLKEAGKVTISQTNVAANVAEPHKSDDTPH